MPFQENNARNEKIFSVRKSLCCILNLQDEKVPFQENYLRDESFIKNSASAVCSQTTEALSKRKSYFGDHIEKKIIVHFKARVPGVAIPFFSRLSAIYFRCHIFLLLKWIADSRNTPRAWNLRAHIEETSIYHLELASHDRNLFRKESLFRNFIISKYHLKTMS